MCYHPTKIVNRKSEGDRFIIQIVFFSSFIFDANPGPRHENCNAEENVADLHDFVKGDGDDEPEILPQTYLEEFLLVAKTVQVHLDPTFQT